MPLPSLSTPIGNTGISIDPSKAVRTAMMIAKANGRLGLDAGGNALKSAINTFSQDRNAEFGGKPTASANADERLLQAMLWPQEHQLAVAEPPQERQQPIVNNYGDLGDEIERGARFLKGEPAEDDKETGESQEASFSAATGHQTGNAPPVVSGVHVHGIQDGNEPPLITTKSFRSAPYTGYISPEERDLMIRTVAGEAGNQGPIGQAAVAHVILNRAMDKRWGDGGINGVILAPLQFSTWNKGDPAGTYARNLSPDGKVYQSIGHVVDGVTSGNISDPTNGATYFYAPRGGYGMKPGTIPAWAPEQAAQNDITIGGHRFLGRSNFDMDYKPTESAEAPPQPPSPVQTQPLPSPQLGPQLNDAAAGPQAQAAPMSNLYDKVAFSPDVQAGYDNPQVMFDPNDAPAAARGGSIYSMPTNELIDKALRIIRRRRDSGGSTSNDNAMSRLLRGQQAADLRSALITYGANANNGLRGGQFGGQSDADAQNAVNRDQLEQLWGGDIAPASPTAPQPTTPNTPAVPKGQVGNQGGPGGVGINDAPTSGPPSYDPANPSITGPTSPIPMASPTPFNGYNYNNTLDQVLGTNNPTQDQIFGFNYPQNLPAPKPQPVGPVSQNEINALYGFGGGSQMGTGTFNSGGAVLMDALTRANKARENRERGGRLQYLLRNLPDLGVPPQHFYDDDSKLPQDYTPIGPDSRVHGYDQFFNNPPQPDANWSTRDSDYRSYPSTNEQAIRRGGEVKGKR